MVNAIKFHWLFWNSGIALFVLTIAHALLAYFVTNVDVVLLPLYLLGFILTVYSFVFLRVCQRLSDYIDWATMPEQFFRRQKTLRYINYVGILTVFTSIFFQGSLVIIPPANAVLIVMMLGCFRLLVLDQIHPKSGANNGDLSAEDQQILEELRIRLGL